MTRILISREILLFLFFFFFSNFFHYSRDMSWNSYRLHRKASCTSTWRGLEFRVVRVWSANSAWRPDFASAAYRSFFSIIKSLTIANWPTRISHTSTTIHDKNYNFYPIDPFLIFSFSLVFALCLSSFVHILSAWVNNCGGKAILCTLILAFVPMLVPFSVFFLPFHFSFSSSSRFPATASSSIVSLFVILASNVSRIRSWLLPVTLFSRVVASPSSHCSPFRAFATSRFWIIV